MADHARQINDMITSPWRSDFPALSKTMNGKPLAFLDTAASAQKPEAVIQAMDDVLRGGYANIHRGLYAISQDLSQAYDDVRKKVAGFINARSENEIVFTRNTTEAINLVAASWGRSTLKAGDEVIITEMEHHANIVPWQLLAAEKGIVVKAIPVTDDGLLNIDAFRALLSERTKYVGVVAISNALGTVNPISEIISITRAYNENIRILVDGTQSVVHGAVDVQALDCDFFTFTGHKLYGPSGVGVLYGKYDVLQAMPPYQGGGDMIERVSLVKPTTFRDAPFKFEAGTPAIVEVIGLGAAIDYVTEIGIDTIAAHEAALLAYATERLSEIEGLTLYGPKETARKAAVLSFTLDGVHSSDIGMILDQCGVAVRSGHHCAMPLMDKLGVEGTTRASIGMYTDQSDIDALITALKKVKELFG